ncbi:MAG: pyruvoyl-dependent arginine decarboxylase [Actinomycetota bacterium]|nr:pyruvoyl-dependent arginine decarboxylase [Actinomycetota bacterium]
MSSRGLDIVISSGTGAAPTELAAFDAALHVAGVAHFNLIRLSSLIPPGSRILVPEVPAPIEGGWGDRLYAVYADHRVSTPARRACAGLGWVQDEDTGAGVLVEHCGDDPATVEAQLEATLGDVATRRPGRYRGPEWRVAEVECVDVPVAAVVVAALRVEPW